MSNYETMEQSGHAFFCRLPGGSIVLRELENNALSIWYANKHHASYGIIYNNTHLEFARGVAYFDLPYLRDAKPKAVIEYDAMHACYRVVKEK